MPTASVALLLASRGRQRADVRAPGGACQPPWHVVSHALRSLAPLPSPAHAFQVAQDGCQAGGSVRRDHHRRQAPLRDDRLRHPALPRHQRQRQVRRGRQRGGWRCCWRGCCFRFVSALRCCCCPWVPPPLLQPGSCLARSKAAPRRPCRPSTSLPPPSMSHQPCSVTKSKFDNVYGCRHSLPDGIMRATGESLGDVQPRLGGGGCRGAPLPAETRSGSQPRLAACTPLLSTTRSRCAGRTQPAPRTRTRLS